MVSANPTGPITVAHARNGAYGDSVARLLAFAGHEVEREYYYNDAGAQMERFHASVEAVRRGEEPPEDGYRGEYVAELAALPGDPVPEMLRRIEATLERFRVHFDTWERESDFGAEVAEALPLLDTYESEGAVWGRTTAHGDDKDRVLVRSNGEPTYFGKDAAYIRRKLAAGFDRLVYVLGADHHGYVARLRALAEMLGYSRDAVEVLVYQLVQLVEGGEARKMSKRRGDVVVPRRAPRRDRRRRRALVPRVARARPDDRARRRPGRGALSEEPRLLRAVRARPGRRDLPIGRGADGLSPDEKGSMAVLEPELRLDIAPTLALEPEERELVKRLLDFPQVVREATERRAVHAIPIYAIRLADDFHRFYHRHRVLESEQEAFRLGLVSAVQSVIARCLDLIGVEAPERM